MKVLHVNLNYDVSSLYKHFTNSLIKQDCEVSVYFPSVKKKKANVLPSYVNNEAILRDYDRLFFYRRNKKVFRHLEKQYNINKFQIVHAHSLFSNGSIAYDIKKKYGTPYIVAVRNTDINVFFRRFKHMRRKGLEILLEAEKIIFLSVPYKKAVLEKYIPEKFQTVIEKKIEVIPNGIDEYWLNNIYKKRNNNYEKKVKILSVGIINKGKNALATAEACQLLREKHGLEVELMLVGKVKDKRYFNKIKKYSFVKHYNHQSKIELLNTYREFDIFVMPSIRETFGLVYAEAMSQGLPVIYTKGQGFDKQFSDGVVGYSVNDSDAQDIASKILNVLGRYDDLSANCTKLVSNFSWDKISLEYMQIYNDINQNNIEFTEEI